MLLTGSRALDIHCGRPNSKSDWDFIASEDELNEIGLTFVGQHSTKINNVEFLNKSILGNDIFIGDGPPLQYNTLFSFPYKVCTLQELYIQKRSHIHRPLNFMRHIHELEVIKNKCMEMGCWPVNLNQLKQRIKLTKQLYKDNVPSLNKTNDDFFDDAVKKQYVHDDIHIAMAHYGAPIYESLKVDKELAKCERDLWDMLLHRDKIKCVLEEAYVIALERFIIPKMLDNQPFCSKISFLRALEKICTTLTSGWFRDFAIDNYFEIKNSMIDYVDVFNKKFKG
jgi:hypothetical protein